MRTAGRSLAADGAANPPADNVGVPWRAFLLSFTNASLEKAFHDYTSGFHAAHYDGYALLVHACVVFSSVPTLAFFDPQGCTPMIRGALSDVLTLLFEVIDGERALHGVER